MVGVPNESISRERRVALVPSVIPTLTKAGVTVIVQRGAGEEAGYVDSGYETQGASIVDDRAKLFSHSQIIPFVKASLSDFKDEFVGSGLLCSGHTIIGLLNPFATREGVVDVAKAGITSFSLELLPRITRAQPMDALTAMATISGYKSVLLAADKLGKMFPMMITAAGTITPARVFVVGAGVAGLQAISTARRLGAAVQAYDVRPAVKEQVESLGAKFIDLALETKEAEAAGGYAKAMGEEFYRRQREMMGQVVADSDVVITTAAIPGKKAPVLLTQEMIQGMRSGSVVVDLAAESGGNCEATRPGEEANVNGVAIIGPVNLPSSVPYDASQMYARNITAFLQNLVQEGEINLNLEDPIIADTLLTHGGEVVNRRVREQLGLPPLPLAGN